MKKAYLLLIFPLFLSVLSGCGNNKSTAITAYTQPAVSTVETPSEAAPTSITKNDPTATTSTLTPPVSPSLTLAEVAKHNSATDCWMAINSKVYNLSAYIKLGIHPGGDKIIQGCGQEASAMFIAVNKHQGKAINELQNYFLGNLQ